MLGIVAGAPDGVAKLVTESQTKFPVVVDNGRLGRILNSDRHEYYVFLLDERKRILFSSESVQPDDLRQICERYVLGSIKHFRNSPASALSSGETLPVIEGEDPRNGVRAALSSLKDG